MKLCSETQVLLTPYTFQPLHHSGSDYQAAKTFGPGAATLKPRDAKVVQTRGTDNRLAFAERRERVGV